MHDAKLVWITPDSQKLVGKIARVSNPDNENNDATAPRLIKYLIKHRHWSPLEMVSMCVEISTTRAIAAQVLRHRSFSFQEWSQRYSKAMELSVPELRRQDTKNRQNSIDDIPNDVQITLVDEINDHFNQAQDLYNRLLTSGVAKECARGVLPLNTNTRLYMAGTLRSWLHYCDLRCANGTQEEHKRIADSVKEILSQEVPDIYEAMWC